MRNAKECLNSVECCCPTSATINYLFEYFWALVEYGKGSATDDKCDAYAVPSFMIKWQNQFLHGCVQVAGWNA